MGMEKSKKERDMTKEDQTGRGWGRNRMGMVKRKEECDRTKEVEREEGVRKRM